MDASRTVNRRYAATTAAIFLLVGLLVAESFLGVGIQQAGPPLRISVAEGNEYPSGVVATFTVASKSLSLGAHLALVASGGARASSGVYVLLDPAYPALYSDYGDLTLVPPRIQTLLELMGSSEQVHSVLGSQVQSTLLSHPDAVFVVVGTPVPDSVLSPISRVLSEWVRAGGTLVWAGGPLGFSAGHTTANGPFVFNSLDWGGQLALAGFPLTDVARIATKSTTGLGPVPPLVGTNASPLSAALNIEYPGTADGANVTEVSDHGGAILGSMATPAGPPGVSPRTSLAYIPEGEGGIYYFGGADLSSYQAYVPFASGWITGGTLDVASDIAELIGLEINPVGGPSTFADLTIPPGGTSVRTLTLDNYSGATVLLVRSSVDWTTFVLWGESVACPTLAFRPTPKRSTVIRAPQGT